MLSIGSGVRIPEKTKETCFSQQNIIKSKAEALYSHLCTDEIPVLVAVHLPVLLEHAVLGTSTHEVEITLAGRETAADSGPRLPTAIATLTNENQTCSMLILSSQVHLISQK